MSYLDPPRFNWLPRPSMWQEAQNRAQKQADILANEDVTSAIVNKLSNINNVVINARGTLAAQAALKRVQDATAAKQAKQQAAADLAARNAPIKPAPHDIALSDGTVIKADPTITLAGGTKVNTKAGTLTLPDGTVLSILTGLKVDVKT